MHSPLSHIRRTGAAIVAALILATGFSSSAKATSTTATSTTTTPAAATSTAATPPGEGDGTEPVTESPVAQLLYFQDVHDIAPVPQEDGEHGGIARLATVLNEARATGTPDLTISGGDLGGGTLFGAVFRGEAMVKALNRVGTDVAGFGNHDFDYGVDQTHKLVSLSTFPWVASNISNTSNGKPFNGTENQAVLLNAGDVRIGFLGLTGSLSNSTAMRDVTQEDYVSSAKAASDRLRAQGADIIVALAQIDRAGYESVMSEVSSIDVLLREEDSYGAPAVTNKLADGRIISSGAGNYGTVQQVLIYRDEAGYRFEVNSLPVNESVPANAKLLTFQDSRMTELENRLATRLTVLDRAQGRPQPLGSTVANALRLQGKADFGWINAGGLRADLPAGHITMREALAVLPFGNQLMKISTTGAHLRLALEQAADSNPKGSSGGYPLVAGLKFVYNHDAAPGMKISSLTRDDGTPITDTDTFTLALTNYVYNGGNGVTAFYGDPILIEAGSGGADVDALVAYLQHIAQPSPAPTSSPTATSTAAPSSQASSGASASPAVPEPNYSAPYSSSAGSEAHQSLAHTGIDATALMLLVLVSSGAGLALLRGRNRADR